jgi:16S rRNA (cytosine1402-N4)-methyltransferase
MWRNVLNIIEENVYNNNNNNFPKVIGDMTIGSGNHSKLILENFDNSHVIGVDIDNKMIEHSSKKLQKYIDSNRLCIIEDSYVSVQNLVISDLFDKSGLFTSNRKFDCILIDLGFNSMQLEDNSKGISFKNKESDLDMRYDTLNDQKSKASDILNNSSELELIEIFKKFGEEKYYELLVTNIIKFRDKKFFAKVGDFLEVIDDTFKNKAVEKFNTYTRLFQALRIAVNYELLNVQRFLPKAMLNLELKGILIAITFHSLEDKMIKNYFKELEKLKIGKNLFKHSLRPEDIEIEENSRSKSAILRAICFDPK